MNISSNYSATEDIKLPKVTTEQRLLGIAHDYSNILKITSELCEHCRELVLSVLKENEMSDISQTKPVVEDYNDTEHGLL